MQKLFRAQISLEQSRNPIMSYQRKDFDKDRPLQYPFLRQRMAANYEPLVVLVAAKLRAQYFSPEKGPVLTL